MVISQSFCILLFKVTDSFLLLLILVELLTIIV